MISISLIDRRPAPRPEVSAVPLDDELVLCDARDGQAYVLNQTGAWIWELCDGHRTVQAMAQVIAARYGVADRDAGTDVDDLVTALQGADLIVLE